MRTLWMGALALMALGAGSAVGQALAPLPYAEAQASHGQTVYLQNCSGCHGPTLQGGGGGPALTGRAFRARWDPQGGDALFNFVREKMPPGAAGSLGDAATYGDVVAYILKANGGKAGPSPFPADPKALSAMSLSAALPPLEKLPFAASPPHDTTVPPDAISIRVGKEHAELLRKVRPVTDEMLRKPPAGDWINWRGAYDAQGFAGLDQINRDNVAKLQPAWGWQLAAGTNEITPLAHDGILYVVSSGRLEALDGATGDLLWQYQRPGHNGLVRNLAIYGDLIYLAAETTEVALDMRTGKVAWEKELAAVGDGVRFGSGPIAAKGKIFQGMGNCYAPYPGGCFIVALDARTGAEVWRFHTIARAGTKDGETWNGAPTDQRFGASIWLAGSYDPDLDLLFFGTGQTYKTASLIKGKGGRAPGLYTDTTLALRPDTGELVWRYQHMAGDVWDLDWAFERTLATIAVDGKPRRTVTTSGKLGIFDTLDAATGKYLFSTDVGLQDLVKSIDPKTGAKTIDPKFTPEANVEKIICTGTSGGRDWPATAYNPNTGVLFAPLNETCMGFTWIPGTTFDWMGRRVRANTDGMVGRVQAIDLANHKTLWTRRERSPHVSAILATGGGLIFEGTRDRWFRASDDRTGKVLWQTRLEAPPSAYPITYSVGGVQYVAVTAGGGNPVDSNTGLLTPEIVSPSGGVTLWVFRLPPEGGPK